MKDNEILNQRWTFFTASGTFTGTVSEINETRTGFAYGLDDVIFRPAGDFKTQFTIPSCAVYSANINATTAAIEPLKFESVDDHA